MFTLKMKMGSKHSPNGTWYLVVTKHLLIYSKHPQLQSFSNLIGKASDVAANQLLYWLFSFLSQEATVTQARV